MTDPRDISCPWNEQSVGWALHALEPDEEMAVQSHVPRCESCQATVRDAEEVLAHLGAAVEQVDPPASLRDAILSAAAATPQRSPMPEPRTSSAVVPVPSRHRPGPKQNSRPPSRDDERTPRRSWLSRRRLLAASLALVGVLTVGGLAIRTTQLEQQRDAETAQAQSIADLMAQLDRPGARHALLAADDGSMVAAVLVADGQRQVFTIGLPANAADRTTYVLWGIKAGAAPQSLGTFDVAQADRGVRPVGSGAEADGFDQYAISLEPGRTPPASPSPVVAKGEVAI